MTHSNSASIFQNLRPIALLAAIVFAVAFKCGAFPLDAYTTQSRLATGRWLRIEVDNSGLYLLTTTELRRHGFTNPEKVRVYGYGGQRISDILSRDNYIDDLIATPCKTTSKGVVFYARGVETWKESTINSGRMVHSLNPYSTTASYFITEISDTDSPLPLDGTPSISSDPSKTFTETIFHESELVSPGQSGHLLVGEDFRFTKSRNFTFPIVDSSHSEGWFECRFATKSTSVSKLTFAVNSVTLPSLDSDKIGASASTTYATSTSTRHTFSLPQGNSTLNLSISFSGESVGLQGAWLDAISLNYERKIALSEGLLVFSADNPSVLLANASAETTVWDVTDPQNPFELNTTSSVGEESSIGWTNPYAGHRTYAAWNENGRFGSPISISAIENQNIHGEETPHMVIFTPREFLSQANRLAQSHRDGPDNLKVLVVESQKVYNEFSSGTPDIAAFRRLLKMFHDRSGESDTTASLRYALLFGRASHDNRCLTADMRAVGDLILPCWQTDEGLRESNSFMTDDFLAFLDDNSGLRLGSDKLCVGVGRLPIGTLTEAKNIVDKILNFTAENNSASSSRANGAWKNRVILTADDGDNGVHLTQTERQYGFMIDSNGGSNMTYTKVYVDAYDEEGGESKIGRELLHRALREGVAWWNYIGHGNTQRLGSEGLIIYNDLNQLTSRNPAFFYAATCSFLRWDGVDKSACEILMHNPSGGIIGAICPTREVYISENAYISNAIARTAFSRDKNGKSLAVGDIMRIAKNNLIDNNLRPVSDNSNKLRYVLMADPAMKLATPDPIVKLTRINDVDANLEEQPTIRAREMVTLEGEILDPTGRNRLDDFNGTLTVQLFDAEQSVTTQGRPSDDTNGERKTFEQQGDMIYTGCDSISNGHFTLTFAMPSEIANNFRPAMLNMYAREKSGTREAIGVSRDFYVYGLDETAVADTIAPTIDYAYLNHSSFVSGDPVNNSPMFIAAVSDNMGINISTAGVGRQLTLKIDDKTSYNDLASYYMPSTDGTPGGTIAYPLADLTNGHHQLSFRVWDTAGNSATHTFDFNVRPDLQPSLFDIFTDANPAIDQANFYLSHNRPDQTATVTIEIFNLNGRLEWSKTVTDRSDMFTTAPISWDLRNNAGHRVARGIYLYRATMVCDGMSSKSLTKRIAVAAGS